MSLVESVANVSIGYVIAILTQMIVFPIFGIQVPLHQQAVIGLIFTGVSIIRSYAIRRLFNSFRGRA